MSSLVLEHTALHDLVDHVTNRVALGREAVHDPIQIIPVGELDLPAGRVDDEIGNEVARDFFLPAQQEAFVFANAREFFSTLGDAAGVDQLASEGYLAEAFKEGMTEKRRVQRLLVYRIAICRIGWLGRYNCH